jgi:hypothetical protein
MVPAGQVSDLEIFINTSNQFFNRIFVRSNTAGTGKFTLSSTSTTPAAVADESQVKEDQQCQDFNYVSVSTFGI